MMSYTIKYNQDQLETVAEYLFRFNRDLVRVWKIQDAKRIQGMILNTIRNHIETIEQTGKWSSWTTTGGYTLIFTQNEENDYVVEITVDMTVGFEIFRITTEIHN
jgi:hypothetical protein